MPSLESFKADGEGAITFNVIITCIVAGSGGLIFGYDIGISGGVTTMEPFLLKFFPSVLKKVGDAKTSIYCVYDSQVLTAFTSSLYLSGLVASLTAGRLTIKFGRKNIMVLGGFTFLLGSIVNGAAENVLMLILGRILLGFGVGFTNQATPIYLSEMAPTKWRGAFNTAFEFFIGIGVVAANSVNLSSAHLEWGWRLALSLAAAPAIIMTLGALLVPDTPLSLVERGKLLKAKKALRGIRGPHADVEGEVADLVKVSQAAKAEADEPFRVICERQYRPHLVMAVAIPFFQQFTGITIIAFYAPVLFKTVGFGGNGALMAAIVLGVVNLGSVLVSTAVVDRFGRKVLFKEGGIQMFVCQVAVGCLLAFSTGSSSEKSIPKSTAAIILGVMCIYSAGFGWSWGPLSWLIPSEIFPMRIRPAGQSISVAVQFLTTFVLSQTFLTMLCHFKYGTFLFFAFWIAVMTLFIALFLPETKEIPLESMHTVWEKHWYWNKFVQQSHMEC